ncbi:hypothetical protein Kfla_6432 [Kribbella flavida DSM 17836]|uniref:Transmembrane protein n=1 Tax=Kribbella flavida (strain DSM 17836 / JCM 10339 / NBRC 14399) TaxID=479435 RepID=D2PX49_KRIFD|nr:hypothetical protein [Kribbella flavida]ADB35429.1 hypothetical protein Kfla_6432 [Kribbella flavida DSM 17836]
MSETRARRLGGDPAQLPGELPDEELPRRLDQLERRLTVERHRWFARATLLAALPAGLALLLPWIFSRRLGQTVWQLGLEAQPALLLTWLAGLAAAVVALWVRPGRVAQAAAVLTGVIALLYVAGGWQANTASALSDTWPGPGPAIAVVTGVIWLLCATAHLIADRQRPSAPDDEALAQAVLRLRQNR